MDKPPEKSADGGHPAGLPVVRHPSFSWSVAGGRQGSKRTTQATCIASHGVVHGTFQSASSAQAAHSLQPGGGDVKVLRQALCGPITLGQRISHGGVAIHLSLQGQRQVVGAAECQC